MRFKALPIAIFLALPLAASGGIVVAANGPSLWTAPLKTQPNTPSNKAPMLKDAPLPAMHDARLTLHDVIIARYADDPAPSGLFHFFRKMTVLDRQLTDRDLYIPWLSRDEALPKVGAHCDIRYHMGPVGGAGALMKADTPDAQADSPIMDDFVCKPLGKT